MIAKITRAYTRRYVDNDSIKSYVEWVDTKGEAGRTEGYAQRGKRTPIGEHMQALFERAKREGVTIEHETW
jgi:hypothetical protein